MAMGQSSTRRDIRSLVFDPALLAVLFMSAVLPLSLVVSPALPGMATWFGVSDARTGLVMTAITLPPMILAPVVGVLGDLVGRRWVAIPGLLLFGIAGVAIVPATTFPLVLALRGLQGVAMAGIAPLSVTLLGDLFDGSRRTTAQGLRTSTAGTTLAVGPVIAGALAGLAWQYPFLLYGTSFLAAAAVFWFVPETAPERSKARSIRGTIRTYVGSLVDELGEPALLVVLGGGFVRFFSLFGFYTFLPIFAVRTLDVSPSLAGLLIGLAGVRILISPTTGWWISRYSTRFALLACLVVMIAVLSIVPFATDVWLLGVVAVGYGVGDAMFDPLVNDATSAMVKPRNRNGVVGGLRVLKEAGKTAAPAALGVVLTLLGYTALFLSIVAVLALYGLVVAVVLRGTDV